MFEAWEELYSKEIVTVIMKECFGFTDNDYSCTNAESVNSRYYCEAYVFTRNSELAAEIVRQGTIRGKMRKYKASVKTLEMTGDNDGEVYRFTFHFFQ